MMASMTSLVEIGRCHVCHDLLEVPRRLPCPHSFCTKCIEGLLENAPQSDTGAPKLKCPVCRTEHVVPLGGVSYYPTDVKMQELVQSIRKKQKAEARSRWNIFGNQSADELPSLPWEYAELQSSSTNSPFPPLPPSPPLPPPPPLHQYLHPFSSSSFHEKDPHENDGELIRREMAELSTRIQTIGEDRITQRKGQWIRAEIDLAQVRCQIDEYFETMIEKIRELPSKLEARRFQLQNEMDPKQGEIQQNIATLDDIQDLREVEEYLEKSFDTDGDTENVRRVIEGLKERVDTMVRVMDQEIPVYKFENDGVEPDLLVETIADYGRVEKLN